MRFHCNGILWFFYIGCLRVTSNNKWELSYHLFLLSIQYPYSKRYSANQNNSKMFYAPLITHSISKFQILYSKILLKDITENLLRKSSHLSPIFKMFLFNMSHRNSIMQGITNSVVKSTPTKFWAIAFDVYDCENDVSAIFFQIHFRILLTKGQ